jgi:hypothetical protein
MSTQTIDDFESAKDELRKKLDQGKQTANEALHDARDGIVRKVDEYAEEAKEAALSSASSKQRDISSSLLAFSGALRAASEHLANNDQRTASTFILDAAGGMERMSSSLKSKPFEEVLEEVRSFGRANSGALIAGSVLAGLALGRFVKSSNPAAGGGGSEAQTAARDVNGDGAGDDDHDRYSFDAGQGGVP